jgi:hypothetical protein
MNWNDVSVIALPAIVLGLFVFGWLVWMMTGGELGMHSQSVSRRRNLAEQKRAARERAKEFAKLEKVLFEDPQQWIKEGEQRARGEWQ